MNSYKRNMSQQFSAGAELLYKLDMTVVTIPQNSCVNKQTITGNFFLSYILPAHLKSSEQNCMRL